MTNIVVRYIFEHSFLKYCAQMSLRPSRRKNSRKVISPFKEPSGPILKFKWSISAAHLAILEENSSVIFPPINTNHSQRKIFAASSSLRGNYNLYIMAVNFDF